MLHVDGERLDVLLKARGLGVVVAFARATGVDRNTVAAILKNKRAVRPTTLRRFASALNVYPSDFLEG